jgi:UDP-glucose:(heptosyl)LPS alpha-1,3-glucosyltransferase
MRLAFLLFKFFPHGGLQRDFRRITELALERGHSVNVFTLSWSGWLVQHPELKVQIVQVPNWRNHVRYRSFARNVHAKLALSKFDRVVGFNKMPGLDVYFNADPCFVERAMQRSLLYRLSGRFRQHANFEQAVFCEDGYARVLLLSEVEKLLFQRWYNTPDDRFHLMPPNVYPDRFYNKNSPQIGQALRNELGMTAGQKMVLMVGSDFRRKGVDRSIRALAALPEYLRVNTRLYVLGKGSELPMRVLARRLGVSRQVYFLQGRDDVPRFLFAADLLLHPAYQENAGIAIVEAIAAGLPSIVTANCGYAFHVARGDCGIVLDIPFRQFDLDGALRTMLESAETSLWRARALEYAMKTELRMGAEHALQIIEGPLYGNCRRHTA